MSLRYEPTSAYVAANVEFPPEHAGQRLLRNFRDWFYAVFSAARVRRKTERRVAKAWAWLAGGAIAAALTLTLMFLVVARAIVVAHAIPSWLVTVCAIISDVGQSRTVLVPACLALIALAAIATPRLGRMRNGVLLALAARIGFVITAIAVPGLTIAIAKRLIGRMRPSAWTLNDPLTFKVFSWDPALASFPSGHSTSAFAIAVALAALFPRWRWPLWIAAICVAVSRTGVSAHYPSDTLAGALCGIVGALAVRNWFAARRLVFSLASDGTVRTMPGPSGRRVGDTLRWLTGR
jgi:undecaprenyl-diphosphatase